MVLLVTTPRVLSALDAVPRSSRSHLNLPDALTLDSPISHDQLIRLSRHLRSDGSGSSRAWALNSLLHGIKVYRPPPPPKPEPSPEYLASKARLLAAAEQDAYNRLLRPSASHTPPPESTTSPPPPPATATQKKTEEDPLTPSLVLNIFLSTLITGFSVYFALTSFRMSEVPVPFVARTGGRMTEPVRVFLSLFTAGVVGVAEVVIYAVYLDKIRQARVREGKIRERKVVVGREVVGGDGSGDGGEDHGGRVKEGREEIWGRGANGGVRRRVRERWEKEEEG